MKANRVMARIALACGLAAACIRLWQDHTCFDPVTGLADGKGLLVLPLTLLLSAALLLSACRVFPPEGENQDPFPRRFAADSDSIALFLLAGVFLLAFSALTAIFSHGSAGSLIGGFFTLLTAAALALLLMGLIRHREVPPALTLVPVGYQVGRLVADYRADSVNPVLAAYYPEILSAAFFLMVFYQFSAFAFRCGQARRLSFCSAMSAVLSLAAMTGTGHSLSQRLFYESSAVLSIGILLLCRAPGYRPAGRHLQKHTAPIHEEVS